MVGVYATMGLLAVLVASVFVDNLPPNLTCKRAEVRREVNFEFRGLLNSLFRGNDCLPSCL